MAHRKGRSVLTGTGIVLGVAILFGVLVANATTQKGVDNLIASFTGRSDVIAGPVGAFDAKLPMGSIERIKKLPDVKELVGEYSFSTALAGYPSKSDPKQAERVVVNGIIPAEAQKIRDYPFDAGHFPTGTSEIVITRKLSDDTGLKVGGHLTIRARKLKRDFTIAGVVNVKDLGGFNGGGGRAYLPMNVARAMQGDPPGTFDGAAIILTPGVDVDKWIDAHRNAVPGVRLENSNDLAAGFKQFLSVFGAFLAFFAAITLFVGAFLIYLTLSMAVIERTRIYGTLRALGATAKQVRRVVMREAIALGIVSTIVGLLLGLVLALGLLQLIGRLFRLDIPGLQVTPGALITTVLIGIVVTLVSAMIPARRAGKLAPIVAMKGDYIRDTKLSRAWIAGAILLVVSVIVNVSPLHSSIGPITVIFILLGAVLVVPVVLRPVSQLLGRLTHRIAQGVGDIAVLHLAKERSRSAYTLALVMVVMAMLFATGGLYLSVRSGIGEIVDRQFGADVFVQPQVPDDGTFGAKLAREPGVDRISPIRFGFSTAIDKKGKAQEFFLRTIEPDSYFAVSSYFWKNGNDADAKAALTRGGAVIATEEVVKTLDAKVGDMVTLDTTRGKHAFKVVATYIGAAGPPEMTIGIKDAKTYLSASRPFAFALNAKPGADPNAVSAAIKKDLAQFQPRTQTSADAKNEARNQISTYFQILYAILLIAGIVGLLGLANTLAMSVLQRFREIGILRAIGVTRSQTWRMVLVESSTLGLTAFILSMPLGGLLTYLVVRGTSEGFGFSIPTLYPWIWVPFVAIFALFIAVVAAIAPGRRASRLEVVSALQYE